MLQMRSKNLNPQIEHSEKNDSKLLIIGKNGNLARRTKELNSSATLLHNIHVVRQYISSNTKINIIFTHCPIMEAIKKPEIRKNYYNYLEIMTQEFKRYQNNIESLVFISSASVYGVRQLASQEYSGLTPQTEYARLKVKSEEVLQNMIGDNNIRLIIARLFNLYGHNDKFSIISRLINSKEEGNEVTILNNGKSTRDFVFIDDAISVILEVANQKKYKGAVNIGTGQITTIEEVIRILEIDFNVKMNYRYSSKKDVNEHSKASIEILKDIAHVPMGFSIATKELNIIRC